MTPANLPEMAAPELVCYVHPGWAPRIRPAATARDWMDESPERFAYRCLPLAVANAHGWEIGSPCGFAARWLGGAAADAVEIRVDPGTPPEKAPVALFGMGTLTLHVEGLIRTSPGWNLWVGGPPNAAKDGLAPLGGVIETDWSPYSFTMNWRFTRPNQWVRFEEDEPFCFFFPVERGVLDRVVPELRPIADDSALATAFADWSRSRDAFHEHVRRTSPQAPADKWQKLYYRGLQPDGTLGASDHQAKLRVRPFAGAPESCPVPMRTAPGVSTATDLALKRRDWLFATIERQRALSPVASGIARVERLGAEDFLHHFYAPGRPVIVAHALDDWPALERWTPEYLRTVVGAAPIAYQGGRTEAPDFEPAKDRHRRTMPFDGFIDTIAAGSGDTAYITAYNSHANAAALKPLMADTRPLPWLAGGEGMLWIGPAGTFTPLHFDLTNTLLAHVTGTKRIVLLPPSETPHLANTRHVFSDVHDVTDPAMLARYPAAATARRFDFDLQAGELLFIPIGWWHQVRATSFSTMLTFTDFLWPNDASESFPHA